MSVTVLTVLLKRSQFKKSACWKFILGHLLRVIKSCRGNSKKINRLSIYQNHRYFETELSYSQFQFCFSATLIKTN